MKGSVSGLGHVVWERSEPRLRADGWTGPREGGGVGDDDDDDDDGDFFDLADGGQSGNSMDDEGCESDAHGPESGLCEAAPGGGGGRAPETVVQEAGLRYAVSLKGAQKTGFYCDQRENRLIVRGIVKVRRL